MEKNISQLLRQSINEANYYTITKRETVVNGTTKVFKKVVTPNDVRPFFEFFLPEKGLQVRYYQDKKMR